MSNPRLKLFCQLPVGALFKMDPFSSRCTLYRKTSPTTACRRGQEVPFHCYVLVTQVGANLEVSSTDALTRLLMEV